MAQHPQARSRVSRRLVVAVFVVAATIFVFFGIRLMVHALRWPDAQHEAIAGWMTPRYVAHSWDVPPEVVAEALGLDQDGTGRRITLEQLAAERGVTVQELGKTLESAIAVHRKEP